MNFVGKYCMCVGGTSGTAFFKCELLSLDTYHLFIIEGIGQGIARRLGRDGANVIIVGRNQEVFHLSFHMKVVFETLFLF